MELLPSQIAREVSAFLTVAEVINLNCSPGPAGYDPHLEDEQKIPLWRY